MSTVAARWKTLLLAGTLTFVPVAAAATDPIESALRAEDHVRAEAIARERLARIDATGESRAAAAFEAVDGLLDVLLDGERIDAPDLDALLARDEALASAPDAPPLARVRALTRKVDALAQRRDFAAYAAASRDAADAAALAGERERPAIALQVAFREYYLEREPQRGLTRATAAVDALRRARPAQPRLLAKALRLRARMLLDAQRLDEAVPAMRECADYVLHTFGARSARYSDASTWLGFALRESGRYADGIEALQRGVAIAAQLHPYRQRTHVDALIALAQNFGIIGDTRKAQQAFEQALAIEERHTSANGYLLGLLLNNLGTLHGNRGEYGTAERYFERAAPLYARVFGADSPKLQVLLKNRSESLLNLGRLDEASEIMERLIATNEAAPAAIPGSAALLPYRNLGLLRLWQRRYGDAEALYRRFLELLGPGRDFHEVNPRSATAGLAASLWGQGRHAEAFAQAREAQRIAARARRNALDQLSERQVLAFEAGQDESVGLAVAIAADAHDVARIREAWQLAMDAAGYVTRAMAMRNAAAAATSADSAPWVEWREAGARLSAARVAATRSPDAANLDGVDAAQDALDAIERRIAAGERGRTGRMLEAGDADFGEVIAALPADAALVRFIETDDDAPQHHDRVGYDAHVLALVRDAGREPAVVDLGSRAQIAARVAAWYALAAQPRADADATATAAKALRRVLLDPLALQRSTRLVFVLPSPELERVSFAALLDDAGTPLAETGPAFHLLNHERDLLQPAADAPHSLLLAGASGPADGDARSLTRAGCPSVATAASSYLPGAAREIADVRALARPRIARVDVLSGSAATEDAVRAAMPGHAILHFATHAFAIDGRCIEGTRGITLDDHASPSPGRSSPDVPLAALAFAPPARSAGADDGLLTGEEIATLDLAATDWVVLSACETALGVARGSEGVFGLRRAFRLAGAGGVVMSLWKVEDRATAEFMQALYRARLDDGADMPTAMRNAMRAVRAARAARGESLHPLYWAGFVAAGRWR